MRRAAADVAQGLLVRPPDQSEDYHDSTIRGGGGLRNQFSLRWMVSPIPPLTALIVAAITKQIKPKANASDARDPICRCTTDQVKSVWATNAAPQRQIRLANFTFRFVLGYTAGLFKTCQPRIRLGVNC
jgi:hypothetical protein